MKPIAVACLTALLVVACATPGPADLKPGASADEIKAQMGTPVATHTLPNGGQRLEFSGRGAMTYMVDVDASGRLVKWTQVLTEANFRTIVPGMTREQVLMTLGQPSNVASRGRLDGQVWSYNFRNTQCQWFQVSLDGDGRTIGAGSMALLPACMNAPS